MWKLKALLFLMLLFSWTNLVLAIDCLSGDLQRAIYNLQTEMVRRKLEIGLLDDTTFNLQVELSQVEATHLTDFKNANSFLMNLQSEMFFNHDLILNNAHW